MILSICLTRRTYYSSNFYFTEWVGDLDSETGGRLGLWQICQKDELADVCSGKLADIMSMPSIPFQVSTK